MTTAEPMSSRRKFRMFTMARVSRQLPDVLLRHISRFVGLFPSVGEAVGMPKTELRALLARATRRSIAKRLPQSTLILRVLLPLIHPELDPDQHKQLYLKALRRQNNDTKRKERRRELIFSLRAQLARSNDVARTADLLQQLHIATTTPP